MDASPGDPHESLLPSRKAGPVLEELCLVPSSPGDGRLYSIKVVDAGSVFEVQRLCRDFCWLDEALAGVDGVSSGQLPAKDWLGVSQRLLGTHRFLAQRQRRELERYLRCILSQVESVDSVPPLAEFLGSSQHLRHSHSAYLYQDMCALVRKTAKHEAGHLDSVNYVAVSADMTLIVSASEDATCRVWGLGKARRWHCLQLLSGHTAGVDGVAISVDLSMIGTSSEDTTCRLWLATEMEEDGAASYQCAYVLRGHSAAVRFLAIASDDSFVATVSDDGTARLWGPGEGDEAGKTWSCQAVLEGHEAAVYGVSIARDLSFIATASDDKTCRVWCRQGGEWACHQVLEGHEEGLYSVNSSDCGSVLATTGGDNVCRLWERSGARWRLLQVLSGHEAAVYDAAIAPDLSLIATGDDSGCCNLWRRKRETGQWVLRQSLRGHSGTIYGVQITPGRYRGELTVGTGSADGTSIMWRYDGKHAYKATHIRPASDIEVALPVLNLCLYVLQNGAMAFKHKFGSHGAVRVVRDTLNVTVLRVDLHVRPEAQFLIKTLAAVGLASLFLFCAATSRAKVAVFALSTALVIPIVRQLFEVFDCSDGQLEAAPGVVCGSTLHLVMAVPAAVVGLCYLLLVAGPYTAAEGDMEVMPRHAWLKPREWMRRKRDKIVGLNLGLISPSHDGGVLYAYVSMASRLLLLAVSIFLNHHERTCCALSLAIACAGLLAIVLWPPMEHRIASGALAAGQALCVNAFLASTLSALLPDSWALLPMLVLFAGWAAIIVSAVVWLRRWRRRTSQTMPGLRGAAAA